MKAYQLHGINDLRFEDRKEPELEDGWVLLEMKAAGVCGSDIPRIYETGTYHFPTVPGHEFSGIVRKGYGKEADAWMGKRAGVFPLIPCRNCVNCRNGDYEMCKDYSYLGSRTDGGFAEYVKVPVWNLVEIPDTVSFEEAAMLEPLAVGIHALRQLPLAEIHSITITGMGPIGLIMAQWARHLGIEQVLLVGNKEQQTDLAEQTGFHQNFNSQHGSPAEWIAKQTNGLGTDAAVDCVGSSEVLTQCLETVKSKGHVLIVGNPKGDLHLPKNTFWKIHRKQLSLHGTWNSGYKCTDETKDDWKTAVQTIQNKEIDVKKLITHQLPFEELEKGLLLMRDKKEFYCKVMTVR